MADFPLFSLSPELLSQVINKFDSESYFRLQKTCKDAVEFVHKSHISIHFPVFHYFALQYDENKQSFHFVLSVAQLVLVPVEVSCLYGTRLGFFKSYAKALKEHFEEGCELLKKNKITAEWVLVPLGLTRAQCATLLQILKPVKVVMKTEESDKFEALFFCGTVSHVRLTIKNDDLAYVLTKSVCKFEVVELDIEEDERDLIFLIRTVLSILRNNHGPALRRFDFEVYGDWQYTSNELEVVFLQFNLHRKSTSTQGTISAQMDMPSDFPSRSSCEILISHSLAVSYRSSYENKR